MEPCVTMVCVYTCAPDLQIEPPISALSGCVCLYVYTKCRATYFALWLCQMSVKAHSCDRLLVHIAVVTVTLFIHCTYIHVPTERGLPLVVGVFQATC